VRVDSHLAILFLIRFQTNVIRNTKLKETYNS